MTPQQPQSETDFLATYDASAFERPSVAVDIAILGAFPDGLRALLVRRRQHPDRGKWALPGGFVGIDESLEDAAERVLATKAGLRGVFLEQLYTFGDPARDPRTRVITIAHVALLDPKSFEIAGSDAAANEVETAGVVVPWEGETGGPVDCVGPGGAPLELAFDHADILGMAVKRIRGKLNYTPIGFQLLPARFTLRDLQRVHETVLGQPLNKDSFRRRMLATGLLEATGIKQRDVGHRPAELYRFSKRSAV